VSHAPASTGRHGNNPGMERKVATVLFADLVDSTGLGEQDPERTRALLGRFYDAMATEVERAGGVVEKFAGDAVMAAFGAPTALEDHPERALHAALAMRSRLAELSGKQLELRIGVNTGEVVVDATRDSSFVTGDAVNVCARLEQSAAPGEILVGERTAQAARGAFDFGDVMHVDAKGKTAPVACRRLVRALAFARLRGVAGLRSIFVGRDRELEQLGYAFGRAVERSEPQLVAVFGDAGVGKSRLVRELWDRLRARDERPLLRTGRCLPYGEAITYRPLGDVLREHLGLLETDPPQRAFARLGKRAMLGLALGLDVGRGLHPLAARDRLHDAWIDFVRELVAERPVVLVVEDLHWAEEPLRHIVERTVRDVTGPLLVVTTARPELEWSGGRRNVTTVWLEPLSPVDSARLVEELPEEIRSAVVEGGEGNPFFIEELASALVDRGVVERRNGVWQLAGPPPDEVLPDSVHAVLAARIDLLAPPEKAALQAAAVVGRVFWEAAVRELIDLPDPDFAQLEDREFIRRHTSSSMAGEREWAIRHALTREVAYTSLPKATRARMHAALAAWLERLGDRDDLASLLAHHYFEAVRPEDADLAWDDAGEELAALQGKAVAWLRRAAALATRRYELRYAVALLERALRLEPDTRVRAEILRELAFTHIVNYDVEKFRSGLEEALALDPDPELAAEVYSLLALYGRGRAYMWTQPPPSELADGWLARALELARPGTAARARALIAGTLVAPQEGPAGVVEAFEIAQSLGDETLINQALEARSDVAATDGRFEEAAEWTDRALSVVERLPAADRMAGAEHFLAAFTYLRAGRIADASAHVDEFERHAMQATRHDRVHATAARALLLSVLGGWPALAALAPRAEETARANEETPCQFNWRTLLMCALGRAHVADEREARRLEQLARANAVVAGPAEREPALLRLTLARGDRAAAERILDVLPRGPDRWDVDGPAARMDALAALGDRARVEEEAEAFLAGRSYYRPFALRALGLVRSDSDLLRRAMEEFRALGLAWRTRETRTLST
jgi:class 3 adenylate cyclase/tetratricopeptide (TPR) repeat protein